MTEIEAQKAFAGYNARLPSHVPKAKFHVGERVFYTGSELNAVEATVVGGPHFKDKPKLINVANKWVYHSYDIQYEDNRGVKVESKAVPEQYLRAMA
ncbi:hypothetical protein NHQ30_010292 [Ciborinia camelliae]|nr:hypothetical protein NHQ30_010292 [Ciborinia camelliae]